MIPRQILDNLEIRVLLVTPDEGDHVLVSNLARGFRHGQHTVEWANSYDAARRSIEAEDHDVYLVVNQANDHLGLDVVAESISSRSHAPFIVLTRNSDFDLDIEALSVGATDHLVLDTLDCGELERAIRHALIHAQTTAELVAARDEAQAATEAKTKFLANISHDVRTPLNAIIGVTEIVLRDDLTPTQRESLETVLVASESLLDLADRLVDVQGIESGEITLDPGPLNIRDTVADVIRVFGLQAKQKGLTVEVSIPTSVPETVVADGPRLQQVLIDLMSNAVRFTDWGRIDIDVEGVEQRNDAWYLKMAIEDTGVGIPADLQSSLFEMSAKSTTASGSTGLGVVQQIINAMSGTISVHSKVGKGSRFEFAVAVEMGQGSAAAEEKPNSKSGGVVLVMSSSPEDRRNIETDLEGGGLEALIVGDIGAAAEAASAAAQGGNHLDAILLDTAYKPFEIAQTLMELAGGSTPVTLLVPGGREGDEPRCREAGIKGYVKKPAQPGVIVDVVKATIAASRAGDTDTLFTVESLGSTRPAMNILVVDDVETNLVLTVRMLTERGHTATAVRSGMEAIDAFGKSRFDAVLMDLQMPGIDGFDATAAMRAEEVLQGIARTPIIALTGHTTSEERERCVSAGMDGFLSKPVRPDALFAAVEQFALSAAA